MRLFYAAYLSHDNMSAYQSLVDRLIREMPGTLRSVPHQTHHLTLAFLGEIADDDVDKCSAALVDVAATQAFDYLLGPPGLLKGRGRPRLIRVNVTEGLEAVSQVQAALLEALSAQLPGIDTRSKPPHVTLARFRKSAQKSHGKAVEKALEHADGSGLPRRDRFRAVHLVRSRLTPAGPVYETVREQTLASDP